MQGKYRYLKSTIKKYLFFITSYIKIKQTFKSQKLNFSSSLSL